MTMEFEIDAADIKMKLKNAKQLEGNSDQAFDVIFHLFQDELLGYIKRACPVDDKKDERPISDKASMKSKRARRTHLRDHLALMVEGAPKSNERRIKAVQTGGFNASGNPYLDYVLYGSPTAPGAYIPALGVRVKDGEYAGYVRKTPEPFTKTGFDNWVRSGSPERYAHVMSTMFENIIESAIKTSFEHTSRMRRIWGRIKSFMPKWKKHSRFS